jgi:hypothetical protein
MKIRSVDVRVSLVAEEGPCSPTPSLVRRPEEGLGMGARTPGPHLSREET